MNTIIDIRIAPAEKAAVTPCELLEDFADCTPSWHFLEEESHYYSSLKGVPACVLRQIVLQPYQVLDFAFSASEPFEGSPMRLMLVDAEHPQDGLGVEQHTHVISRFLGAFRRYLDRLDQHASVQVTEERFEASLA